MDEQQFAPGFPGKLVPIVFTEYPEGPLKPSVGVQTQAFVPNPLPPDLDWSVIRDEQFDLYTKTVSVLGKLNGLHLKVGNAAGLLRTLWMREAKLSSEIENIETTAEDLVLAGAGRSLGVRENSRESWNYVMALEHGVYSDLPWSSRVIKEMHNILLSNVRGDQLRPGEFRNSGVYIGSRSRGVKGARFVPMPPGEQIADAMGDLEIFVNEKHSQIPPLFVIALTHYQFETIHPFSDGNGRIGRVLISRSLVKEGLLEHPVVYMSAYINEHKKEYVDLLLQVSQQGGEYWSKWIGFLLEAIHTQALDAIWRSEKLLTLREKYHNLLKNDAAPARLFQIVDRLFSMPAVNVSEVIELTQVTKPTAGNDLNKLEKLGILNEYTQKQRDRDWLAPEIVNVIEHDSSDSLFLNSQE